MRSFRRKQFVKIISMALAMALIFTSALSIEAKTKKTKISASTLNEGLQFTMTNMPYNGAKSIIKKYEGSSLSISSVQNFAYTPDGKYLFTTSECKTGSKRHTLLCRVEIPEKTGPDAQAECVEAVVLGKHGHGEAIEITQPDEDVEEYNIWVATKPYKNKYGVNIERNTVKIKDGKMKITKSVTIKDFGYANVINGKACKFEAGYPQRRIGLAIDEDNNQIVFRVQFMSGVNYVAYDFGKIDAALDKLADGKSYSIKKARKWQTANLRTNLVPHDTFQSFQVHNNKLYVCGGHFDKTTTIYVMKLKTYKPGKAQLDQKYDTKDLTRIITVDTKFSVKPEDSEKSIQFTKKNLEVEGMKLIENEDGNLDIYINFMMNGKYKNVKGYKMGFQNNCLGIYKFEIKP